MPYILKIRRDWSLLHFKIWRDRSPQKILKIRRDCMEPSIRRDWSTPYQTHVGAKMDKHMQLT